MPTLAEKWCEQGVEQGAVRTLLDQLIYRFALSLFTLDATSIDQVTKQVERLRSE